MQLFNISAAVGCHMGNIRKNNEDNFYLDGEFTKDLSRKNYISLNKINNEKIQVYAVCDGMGGEELGEIASYIAVEVLDKYRRRFINCYDEASIDKCIDDYIDEANDSICKKIIELKKSRIGTTLALVVVFGEKAFIANLGDSRVFLFKNKELVQLSKDHTQAQMLIDSGIKDVDNLSKAKHRLTQHLGIFKSEKYIKPEKLCIDIKKGDKFILASDGLTDMLTHREIENILKDSSDEADIVEKLVKKALANGGKDNVTVLAFSVNKALGKNKLKYLMLSIFTLFIIAGALIIKNSLNDVNENIIAQSSGTSEINKLIENTEDIGPVENAYLKYIKDVLEPRYTNSKLSNDELNYIYDTDTMPRFGKNVLIENSEEEGGVIYKYGRGGIISIKFCDLDGDSKDEMIVVRGENDRTFIQVYTIKDEIVEPFKSELQVGNDVSPNAYYDRQDLNVFVKNQGLNKYICTLVYQKYKEETGYILNIYGLVNGQLNRLSTYELSLINPHNNQTIKNNLKLKENGISVMEGIDESLQKYGFKLDVFGDYESNLLNSKSSTGLYPSNTNDVECEDICIFKLFNYKTDENMRLNFQCFDFTNRNALFESVKEVK